MGGPSDYSDCSGTIARCPPSTGGEGGGGDFYHTKTIVSDIKHARNEKAHASQENFWFEILLCTSGNNASLHLEQKYVQLLGEELMVLLRASLCRQSNISCVSQGLVQ